MSSRRTGREVLSTVPVLIGNRVLFFDGVDKGRRALPRGDEDRRNGMWRFATRAGSRPDAARSPALLPRQRAVGHRNAEVGRAIRPPGDQILSRVAVRVVQLGLANTLGILLA